MGTHTKDTKYKLIGKVDTPPRCANSFATEFYSLPAHLRASNLAKEAGGRPLYGTPKHEIGEIVIGVDNMRGNLKGLVGLIDKFLLGSYFFAQQYKDEWGVYIEVKEEGNKTI